MHSPARWKDDPECGHLVAHKYQTHYCTYIRAPKLLSLQSSPGEHPDEVLAQLALQAIELWLKVITHDVQAALDGLEPPGTPNPELAKLLNRASTLIQLLDRHCDLAESNLLHDLRLRLSLSGPQDDIRTDQLQRLEDLTTALAARLDQRDDAEEPHLRAGRDFVGRLQRWSGRYQRLIADLFQLDRPMAPTFSQYLELKTLLELQEGAKADWTPPSEAPERLRATEDLSTDELMFIVVHQVFELWFKALLHELDRVLDDLTAESPALPAASRRLRRAVEVQRLLADMIHIPATMLPMDFLRFRHMTRSVDGVTYERGLTPASGTESYQFRELEILSGLKHSVAHTEFLHGNRKMHIRFLTPEHAARVERPSLPEAFERLVQQRGLEDLVELFTPADVPNPNAGLAELADLLLEFDGAFQRWRFNHLSMVQSMIGRKSGTGFLGPEYLKETLGMGLQGEDDRLLRTPQIRPRFFDDLWEVRTRMGLNKAG